VVIGKQISNDSLKSTDFLAKAILLSTREDSQLEAPDENQLSTSSKTFLSDLAKRMYDLASSAPDNNDNENSFFQTLANILPLPLFVLNDKREITFVNESAVKYTGQAIVDIVNKPFYDVLDLSFVSPLTLESWLDDCESHSAVADEMWERVRLNCKGDIKKQFDLAAHFSKGDSSGIETVLLVFDKSQDYDLDDQELTYVALAAHELRTPLSIMRGYIEVFSDELKDKLNTEQTTFMHNMSASAQQLTTFVSNILNAARVEQNALNLTLQEESWQEVLSSACRDMELRANVRSKQLETKIADDLPTVAIDKIAIYEVIANLIDNAIKYTHTDELITISSYQKEDMVETTVTDKGVGISQSVIGHIFDKFYRAHHSKNSVGGTGLGLYLCRSIIDAHGGEIWVKSTEGKGSTFGFTLPVYSSVADKIKNEDNKGIVRGAHGWIKNHSLYRE
jgi:signal transduction histidine kinase